ncbi:MAG: CDP-glycerol glycerophosphotransferase family protein [bacterium]|nr:CDP-glycerol glycerophosphotransferase family protein [bacterium]
MSQKTIFISLSSIAAFRNLFFFPESFYGRLRQRLKDDAELRVVLIMPERYYEKVSLFLEKDISERFIIETIRLAEKKTFPQKLFYFVYSHLLYTGTTRLMATVGTRPDEPPAGGRWFLAPIKVLIARTIGRSRWVRLKIVPRIFLKLFPGCAGFGVLFQKYHPDLVFITHLYGWFDTVLLGEAKRHKVKTIGMPAGWDHLDKYFLPFQVDNLLVPSEQVCEAAVRYQSYNPKKIRVVGYTHLDFIIRHADDLTRAEVLSSLNWPTDAKYILYVSGSAYCPDEPEIIENILQWADAGKFGADMRMIIRPYLGGRSKDRAFDAEKFERFKKNPRVRFYEREFWGDMDKAREFVALMRHADAVLAVYTTMVLEAGALDRPLVAVAFDGSAHRPWYRSIRRFEGFEHFQDVLKTGAMRTAYDFDQLFEILDSYFKNPRLDGKERKLLRERLCYNLDGKASERVLDEVLF